jgi:hypothetical protein
VGKVENCSTSLCVTDATRLGTGLAIESECFEMGPQEFQASAFIAASAVADRVAFFCSSARAQTFYGD